MRRLGLTALVAGLAVALSAILPSEAEARHGRWIAAGVAAVVVGGIVAHRYHHPHYYSYYRDYDYDYEYGPAYYDYPPVRAYRPYYYYGGYGYLRPRYRSHRVIWRHRHYPAYYRYHRPYRIRY